MSKRNPILSMSGNMWALLRACRSGDSRAWAAAKPSTRAALVYRNLMLAGVVTDLGRMVCDAYTEGKEQA